MTAPLAPTLHADGLLLRPFTLDDDEAVLSLAGDEDSRTWTSLRTVRTVADARAWLSGRAARGDRVEWAVCDPATGQVVGRVAIGHIDAVQRVGEIGYGVHAAHRRRGVASRAVETALGHGFGELGLARVVLIHAVGNTASCAVARRCGFTYEGTERAALDHGDGVRHDTHRHARLASDPRPPRVG